MTEQEAEVWKERLTRIWSPQKIDFHFYLSEYSNYFDYVAYIEDEHRLLVTPDTENGGILVELHIGKLSLLAQPDLGLLDSRAYWRNEDIVVNQAALDKWFSFFRRGCWLMGYDVEASAHEKEEWMQGFSCEELEAWNLKF